MKETSVENRNFDDEDKKFISNLKKYVHANDRAALAKLRRGLGKKPGTVMEMYPYMCRQIPKTGDDFVYFLVAALFGLYPDAERTESSLGGSLLMLDKKFRQQRGSSSSDEKTSSVERRFVALLNAKKEDLPTHLRQIIGLLKSNEMPINWFRLLKDLKFWTSEEKHNTRRKWAKEFWGDKD